MKAMAIAEFREASGRKTGVGHLNRATPLAARLQLCQTPAP
jgi:hypothetical protein